MKPSKKKGRPPRERVVAKRLAAELDVSVSTISRAFTENAVISPKTRSMVLERAKALGYRPNPFARSLITRKSKIVAIIVSHFDNPFYPEALTRLCESLGKSGFNSMLFSVPVGETPEQILPQAMTYHPEFVIVMATTVSFQAVEEASEAGTSLIFFNRYVPDTPSFSVACDNILGAREIADHLIDNGHHRLAYIAGTPDASTTIDRWKGFREQCATRGVTETLRAEGDTFNYAAGFKATIDLMRNRHRPDAIFCASDILALGALEALRGELGLRVPDDVSVAGFDNISMAAWPSHSLTTYHQPVVRMIGKTLELIEKITANPDSGHEAARIEGRLIIRSSTRSLVTDNGLSREELAV